MELPDIKNIDWFTILGYNFLYHFNPYTEKIACIYRHDYPVYWNKSGYPQETKYGYTEGNTMYEAQVKMYQRINGLIEDGIVGHHTLVKLANENASDISR